MAAQFCVLFCQYFNFYSQLYHLVQLVLLAREIFQLLKKTGKELVTQQQQQQQQQRDKDYMGCKILFETSGP